MYGEATRATNNARTNMNTSQARTRNRDSIFDAELDYRSNAKRQPSKARGYLSEMMDPCKTVEEDGTRYLHVDAPRVNEATQSRTTEIPAARSLASTSTVARPRATTREEAKDAVRSMMEDKVFGESGSRVVIEEFLTGPEVSVLSFTDGKTLVPMVSSMDHKRAHDNDEGLNTGGMGTVAPNPYYTPEIAAVCMEKIFLPTMAAMNAEGRPFKGCLYFGLMLTENGPKVIEYNCRFGDPETQVVLPLLKSDLLTVMQAVAEERLDQVDVTFSKGAATCVIVASKGYPAKYESGFPMSLPADEKDSFIYVAGAKRGEDGSLLSAGGRVLGVTAVRDTLPEAIEGAYAMTKKVIFDNGFYRNDIGARAMKAYKN